ncbi:MAG: PTS sugar transporter subunit IIA [Lentisphaeria bacterium]|nr:PTS sugar transporter subunit IIA [Lentisphaeria bacterium]
MILTLRELAQLLRVNERTILRMLKSGQLKGTKIGGQWRFNSSQVDGLFFPVEPIESGEEPVPLSDLTRSRIGIPVSRIMSEERMVMDLAAGDAGGVITELTDHRRLNALLLDVRELRTKCLAREELLSTGVGHGVAIPHPRDPLPTLRAPAVIVFGRSLKGVPFGSADNMPVHLFFLTCAQTIDVHLHVMGRLARLLRRNGFVEKCLACDTPHDLLRVVLSTERDEFFATL